MCYQNSKDFPEYGGRGIEVCKEWSEIFSIRSHYIYNKHYNRKAEQYLEKVAEEGIFCRRQKGIIKQYFGKKKQGSRRILGTDYRSKLPILQRKRRCGD